MAGSQRPRVPGCCYAAVLAVSFLTFGEAGWAQNLSPPLCPVGMSATIVDGVAAPDGTSAPMTVGGPTCYCDACVAGRAAQCEMSCCDTICESLLGENKWRPLTLGSFFSEGWREPWAGGPAGQSGLTPRHGWLGAFEGVFYRLWLVNGTYQHNLDKPFGGDGYAGNFTTFLPFSRRFELFVNAPFVVANGTEDPTRGYDSNFGDLQVAGSFLLSETAACTQLFTLGATSPTGQSDTGGGLTSVFPRYSRMAPGWCVAERA